MPLSKNLQPIYDLELALGNSRAEYSTTADGGIYISLAQGLHRAEIEKRLKLPALVEWFENHDPHYPIEGGYFCRETKDCIVGPIGETRRPIGL